MEHWLGPSGDADTHDSPRPLRDPAAPRPEGSSIFGFYGRGSSSIRTESVAAVVDSEEKKDEESDVDSVPTVGGVLGNHILVAAKGGAGGKTGNSRKSRGKGAEDEASEVKEKKNG